MLVAWTLHCDTELQVTGNIVKVFALWVHQSYPLVVEGVFFFVVDEGHVELVSTNEFISESALVEYLDGDGILRDPARMLNRKDIAFRQ